MSTQHIHPATGEARRDRIEQVWADVTAAIDDPAARLVALAVELGAVTSGVTNTRPEARHDGQEVELSGDVAAQVAKKFGVERDEVELVFDFSAETPGIVVSASRLAKDRANAARQITQLYAGVRQAASIEEWTAIAGVRAVVADYGRLDSGNFMSSVTKMDDVAIWRGKGTNRELKITKAGFERIGSLIRTLTGN